MKKAVTTRKVGFYTYDHKLSNWVKIILTLIFSLIIISIFLLRLYPLLPYLSAPLTVGCGLLIYFTITERKKQ